ncbi:MAG: hypothetical protein A2Y72_02105 [Chloroflexi bacterium RBG_13_53_26]|nr:MAG: hypothetical protein A2Y72_02105 [Chloroflexi bacterium RBG_13_53_26]
MTERPQEALSRDPRKIVKDLIRRLISLETRKKLAIRVNGLEWVAKDRRSWWSRELIRDLAGENINEYHRFLWLHHLAYAAPYEVATRFGDENIEKSRKMFSQDLVKHLVSMKIDPGTEIRSIFEVGCSLGYQLRFLEKNVFLSARTIVGIDIDRYAVMTGAEYLREIGSKVSVRYADMLDLQKELAGKDFDIVLCSGVLMYLDEVHASEVVRVMLRHTGIMLAITGLAHPHVDNSGLLQSIPRERDLAFIHNIDSMVRRAGGKVIARRWDGANLVDGHSIYFVFATKD